MEVFDAVRTILAVRSYESRPIPDDVIRRIVEAGHVTASAMNRQPWHFVVVQDRETLRRLGEAVKTGPYIAGAQMAVAVTVEKDSRFAESDVSRAVQDMMLVAWEAGVGSNWTGFAGLGEVAKLLDIPEDLDVLAVIPFGYPDKLVGRGKKRRKPLGEVFSRERFGQPFN
jgi:nitroreductase